MSLIGFLSQYRWVLTFYVLVVFIIYLNRKKFDVEAKFVYIYRTKFGLRIIEKLARFKRAIHPLSRLGAILGFGGIAWVFIVLAQKTFEVIVNPKTMGVAPILPGLPIAGTGIQFPFIIGWISLFVIIVIHEFSHGVVAKSFKVPIKSSGIAFFGPVLGAFVEPDESQLQKQPPTVQNAVFAAGPMANLLTGFLFLLILGFLLSPVVDGLSKREGILVSPINGTPAAKVGVPDDAVLAYANGEKIESLVDFFNLSRHLKPNESVVLKTLDGQNYSIITTRNPENASLGYMGLVFKEVVEVPKNPSLGYTAGFFITKWLSKLFFWLYFISINLGLINLFPIFITDGARMLQTLVPWLIKDKKKAIGIWKIVNQFSVLMILILLLLPWIRGLLPF